MDVTMPNLSRSTLGNLPETVLRPRYGRADLTPGIVHIGLGNFHRAHQAWYLHRLMQNGAATDWAIIGAGVRPYDAKMREKLKAQDCLTTLIELDPDHTAVEIVGSMIDYLPVVQGHGPLIAQMVDPSIRIVALTVTESGYYRAGGAFDADHVDILADIRNPDAPTTAFGAIVNALGRRRANGDGPFTVQSCDNLQNNGDIVRDTVASLARSINPGLADWIETHCTFPNAMVDCIVPATGPNEMTLVHQLGINDAAPVTHEPFRHWVIDDSFCAGRPAWEQVGATLTNDVHDFEVMKLRVLNGGHQIVANAGELLGIETIAAAAMDPLISAMFHKVQVEEILPQVQAVPGFTPSEYLSLIERRFGNPRIVDTTRRVAFDGSSRHPGFIFPSIQERLDAGASVNGLALIEALWARMCTGMREDGTEIEANDPHWSDLVAAAEAAKNDPDAWLSQTLIYDEGIVGKAAFRDAFHHHLTRIHRDGVVPGMQAYLRGPT